MRLDVKLAIVRSGRQQYEIAPLRGVSESTLSKFIYERGSLRPEQEARLAELLELNKGNPRRNGSAS